MAFEAESVYQGQLSAVVTTVLATVPDGKKWIVSEIDICNTDTVERALTISAPGTGNPAVLFDALPIGAGETVQWTGHKTLSAGMTICGGCDVADKINVTIEAAEQ